MTSICCCFCSIWCRYVGEIVLSPMSVANMFLLLSFVSGNPAALALVFGSLKADPACCSKNRYESFDHARVSQSHAHAGQKEGAREEKRGLRRTGWFSSEPGVPDIGAQDCKRQEKRCGQNQPFGFCSMH